MHQAKKFLLLLPFIYVVLAKEDLLTVISASVSPALIGGFSGVLGPPQGTMTGGSSNDIAPLSCLLSLQRLKESQAMIQNSTSSDELGQALCSQPQVTRDILDFYSLPMDLSKSTVQDLQQLLKSLKMQPAKGGTDNRLLENTVALLPFARLGPVDEALTKLSFLCTYYSIKNVFPHVVVTVRSADDLRFVESLRLPNAFKLIDVYDEVKSIPSSMFGLLKSSIMILASRFLNPGAKLFHDFQYIYYSGPSPHAVYLRIGKPPGVAGGAGGTDDGPGGGGSVGLSIEEQLLDMMDDSGGSLVLAPHVHGAERGAKGGARGSCCYTPQGRGKRCEMFTERMQCPLPGECNVRMPKRGEATCEK